MLPHQSLDFTQLFKKAIQYHYLVLKRSIWIILLIVLVKDYYVYLGGFPEHYGLALVLRIINALLLIYLWAISLVIADQSLRGDKAILKQNFRQVFPRVIYLYLLIICYIILGIILYYLAVLVIYLLAKAGATLVFARGFSFLFVLSIPFLCILVWTFFAGPLLLLDKIEFISAFRTSIYLTGFKNWLRVLIIYLLGIAILLLISPDTLHGHLLEMYYLSAPYDFIVLIITLPVFNNMIILLLNDLRLRKPVK